MTNLIVNNIFSYLTQEDRYNLFILVCELLGGNYSDKAQALGIKQSTYYQYINKKLEIGDDKTIFMLNLLLNKDQNKFNEFLVPIVKRGKDQFSSILDSIQPTPQPGSTNALLLITTGTVGFTCKRKFLSDLIKMISLPLKELIKRGEEIRYIVLNFDGENVWWSFSWRYGFFTYNFVFDCWGKGIVGLEVSKLLEYIDEDMKSYSVITFWADSRIKTFAVKAGGMSDDAWEITGEMVPIEKLKSGSKIFDLNDDYTPVLKKLHCLESHRTIAFPAQMLLNRITKEFSSNTAQTLIFQI